MACKLKIRMAAVLAALALGTPLSAQQPVRIRVDYVFTGQTRNGQPVSVNWSVGAELQGGNRVADVVEGAWNASRSESLGRGKWRVGSANQLVRVTDWPNSQTVMRVNVTGQSCQATVEERLKPGKSTYQFWSSTTHAYVEMSSASFGNIRCSIS